MSSSRSAGAEMNKTSDKIEELDELLLKTQSMNLALNLIYSFYLVENDQKTAIIVEKQIQLLKKENAEIQESLIDLQKRGDFFFVIFYKLIVIIFRTRNRSSFQRKAA